MDTKYKIDYLLDKNMEGRVLHSAIIEFLVNEWRASLIEQLSAPVPRHTDWKTLSDFTLEMI